MEVLNIVFSALSLLATVIVGVIQVTWMISQDVFRDKPRAKHYSHAKSNDRLTVPQLERSFTLVE